MGLEKYDWRSRVSLLALKLGKQLEAIPTRTVYNELKELLMCTAYVIFTPFDSLSFSLSLPAKSTKHKRDIEF